MANRFQGRDLGDVPFLIVLVVETAALGFVAGAPAHWLRAVGGMVVGLLLAGLFRLVLTDEQAGLLRVRRRRFDVVCYWGIAVLTLAFALTLPDR